MKLIIVESPGKVNTIQSYLGSGWKVMASVGHVRDLPEKTMGVSSTFTPIYVETERGKDVLKRLAAAVSQASDVFLAPDPDREGEAIAWHLQDALKLSQPKRVTFSAITETAIKQAIESPRSIDMHLVQAQEARRVLDRLVGYQVSGPLSNSCGLKLSAGRVQSPAVKLVVEREQTIKTHCVTTHFGVEFTFEAIENVSDGWKAVWSTKNWLPADSQYILDQKVAKAIASLKDFDVTNYADSESKEAPPAPFITSTLQQAASIALKFSPAETMAIAQKLYEIGHITYMRTDSPFLSEEFQITARAFCNDQGLPTIISSRTWKSKEGAQEAHEAIRPTHIDRSEAGETEEQKSLYKLIYLRTLATQLEDAVYAVRSVTLETSCDDKQVIVEAKGKSLITPGWKTILQKDETDEETADEPTNDIPAFRIGDKVAAISSKISTKKTQPPVRFTEASLIKELEKRGIGRPSTFAAILNHIIKKGYIVISKRKLVPTETGEIVVKALSPIFSFMDYGFTKNLEENLDDVAAGKADYRSVVESANTQLLKEITKLTSANSFACPECNANLRHYFKRPTKDNPKEYDFFACKDCDSTFPNEGGKPGAKQEKKERKPQVLSEYKCKAKGCGKALVRRQGTLKDGSGNYDFYGCSGFPKCNQSYPTKNDKPDYDAKK